MEWILWSAIEGLTEISLFKKCISRIKAEESHERDAAITLFQDLLYLVPMSSFVWKTLIIMLWSDHVQSKGLYGFMFFKAFHLKDVNALPPAYEALNHLQSASLSVNETNSWTFQKDITYIDRDNNMTMFICMYVPLNEFDPPSTHRNVAFQNRPKGTGFHLTPGIRFEAKPNKYEYNQYNQYNATLQHIIQTKKQMSPGRMDQDFFLIYIFVNSRSHTLNIPEPYFGANQRFLKGAEVCDLEMPSICRRNNSSCIIKKNDIYIIVFTRNTIAIDTNHCVFSCFFLNSHFKRCSCWASLSRACQRESQIGASKRCSLTGTHKLEANFWKIRSMPIRKMSKVHESTRVLYMYIYKRIFSLVGVGL